jgi:hypothetical protein
MRRPLNLGLASAGVHHAAKVASQSNCIFQVVDQQNDVGIDAYLEFIVAEETTGCCVAIQIKSGTSYCGNLDWSIPADPKHVEYWRSHSLPVCGIVYDPGADSTRWVDISSFLAANPSFKSGLISVPTGNEFSFEKFNLFREHFLAFRRNFSDDAHFGRSLQQLCRLDQLGVCDSALRSLFSFHRNRMEIWFFLINCLPAFQGHPLLRNLAIVLCHVPGHGDIFWHSKNIIAESIRKQAEEMIRRYLTQEGVLSLLMVVDGENGFQREGLLDSVSFPSCSFLRTEKGC